MTIDSQQPPSPQMPEFCLDCGTQFKEGAVFCERCGAVRPSMRSAPPTHHMDWRTWALFRAHYRAAVREPTWRRTTKAVMAYMMISVILSLVAGLVTLIYGISLVAPDILSHSWGDGFDLFIVVPVFIDLVNLSGYALLAYYLLVVAAIVASCAWVFLSSYKGFLKELTMKADARNHSQIFDIAGLVFVEMFAIFVVVILAILFGVSDTETGEEGTLSELLFLAAQASVWEELIVRVLMIGLPLLVIDLVRKNRQRKWHSYVLGGGFKIGIPEIVLLIVSAAIFGYAHYLSGWEAWVVPWQAFGGITFGYLFLRHGLPAAIVLHFIIDYRAMPTMVFEFSEGFEIFLFLLWMALGAVFAIYYIVRIGEFLTGRKYLDERPQQYGLYSPQPVAYSPAPQPPVQPAGQGNAQVAPPAPISQTMQPPVPGLHGGYICPYCGHTEARWIDGRFQCMRCGRLV